MKLLFKISSNLFAGRRVSLEDNDSLIESVLVTQNRFGRGGTTVSERK
jgi:hypothetical protein